MLPARRQRTGSAVRSTTVDGIPSHRPPSTTTIAEPNSPRTALAVARGGSPWRLALVVARGPTR